MKRLSIAILFILSMLFWLSNDIYPKTMHLLTLSEGPNLKCAMQNATFQDHDLHATKLTIRSKYSKTIPHELQQTRASGMDGFTWLENDSTFALLNEGQIMWQFNFNTRYQKPFFHPVYVNKNMITNPSPDDHPWHLGQWSSWKYINNKNFWEYTPRNSYHLEGDIVIRSAIFEKNLDYSAVIHLEVDYYIENEDRVLMEESTIRIAPPHKDGRIQMDYEMKFTAIAEKVVLDRTPPVVSTPDGQLGGGYAGLSVRFNKDLMNSRILSSSGLSYQNRGRDPVRTEGFIELAIINSGYEYSDEKTGDWFYMGFTGPDDKRVGTAIMISKDTKREGEAWYSVNIPGRPFYYFGPAYVYLKPEILTMGESIELKYRVLHIEGDVNNSILNLEYDSYTIPINK